MMRRRLHLTAVIVCFAASPVLSAPPGPGTGVLPEYEVKARFLHQFTQYISWPEEAFAPGAPFVIGIFGRDPFGELIDRQTAGRRSHDRPIEVRRLARIDELSQCHLVYISATERHRQAELLATLEGEAVLSVGETDWFLRDGGGIRLMIEWRDGRAGLRFEVNLAALSEGGLHASSRMLQLAKKVIREEDGGEPPSPQGN